MEVISQLHAVVSANPSKSDPSNQNGAVRCNSNLLIVSKVQLNGNRNETKHVNSLNSNKCRNPTNFIVNNDTLPCSSNAVSLNRTDQATGTAESVNFMSKCPTKIKRKKKQLWSLCEICGFGFTTRRGLDLHIMRQHRRDDAPFLCYVCGQGCFTVALLRDHKNLHTGERPFVCEICGKKFPRKSTLYTHRSFHNTGANSKSKELPCTICRRTFYNKTSLSSHRLTHSNENPYSCNGCGKIFNLKRSFSHHVCVKNSEKKAFSCKTCSAVFQGMSELKQHYETVHGAEKTIRCCLCSKKFYNDHQLKNHLGSHKTKQIKCNFCSKLFKDQHNLKIHQRIHSGEKPYECNVCNKRFSQQSSRNSHLLIHENKKPFSCLFCEKAFRQSTTLTKHCREVHPDEVLNEVEKA